MSQEQLMLCHLPRQAKKQFVRGWNAAAIHVSSAQLEPEAPPSHPEALKCEDPEASNSILQWLRGESATTASSYGGRSLFNNLESDDDLVEDDVPRTVGQVQHVYRTRARQEEAQRTRKYAEIAKGQHHRFNPNRAITIKHKPTTDRTRDFAVQSTSNPRTVKQYDNSDKQEQVTTEDDEGVLCLVNLPASKVCANASYRDEILTIIRQALVAGRQVLLSSDCSITNDSIMDTKFMMQQLCSLSLLYCIRDQDIVPQTHPSPSRKVTLQLCSRLAHLTLDRSPNQASIG